MDPIRDGRNRYVYTANDPVNFIDPWGLAAEDGGKYNNYVDGPQLLNRYIPGYAFVEGGGFTGGISLSGSYTVRPNPDSTFDLTVTATGYTGVSAQGDVNMSGALVIKKDKKVVHTEPLVEPVEPYFMSSSHQMIGEATVSLPPEEQKIDFTVELSVTSIVSVPGGAAGTSGVIEIDIFE